jgi:hypothetical protein
MFHGDAALSAIKVKSAAKFDIKPVDGIMTNDY